MKKLIPLVIILCTFSLSFTNSLADITGTYFGKEKCSKGKFKDQWSNPYEITIRKAGNNYEIIRLYYQTNPIPASFAGDTLKFDSRNEQNDDIKLWGFGIFSGNKLTIEYKAKVQTGPNKETDFIINECTAEFTKD